MKQKKNDIHANVLQVKHCESHNHLQATMLPSWCASQETRWEKDGDVILQPMRPGPGPRFLIYFFILWVKKNDPEWRLTERPTS